MKLMNYFEFFDLPRKLTLDVVALEKQFYTMSRKLHPDRFASKSVAEQEAALAQSEESRKQAEAVGNFMVDALKKPYESADGKDVKVADVLDTAIEKLNMDRTIQSRVKRQMEKAQKEYYLNEKIEAIQKAQLWQHILAQHCRGKRTKALAVFDLEVEVLLHGGRAGIAEDRARAERARTKFHPALKPADRELVGQRLRRCLDHLVFAEDGKARAGRTKPSFDLALREFRTEKRAGHGVGSHHAARLALE